MLRYRGVLLGVAVVVVTMAFGVQVASAATFNVTDPTDAALSTATSTDCASTHNGSCTLRAAVQAADNAGGTNTINLPAGDYQLTIPPACASYSSTSDLNGCDLNDPAQGDLDVLQNDSLTITGAGSATTTVDAAGIDRAFAVESGASLSLSGMTIENGAPASTTCTNSMYGYTYNCLLSDLPTAGAFAAGGGVYSDGGLSTTADVVFRGDQATTPNGQNGSGGAIYADADSDALSLAGVTLSLNFANRGSALYDAAAVAATMTGATVSTNDNSGGNGTIFGGTTSLGLDVTGSTFTNNTSGSGGVFFWQSSGPLSAENSTFTGNSATAGGVILNNNDNHSTSFTGDVIKDNIAYEGGVIVQNDCCGVNADSVVFNNDEVDSNRATYEGVGNFSDGAGLTSSDSSYIGNTGAYGGAFDLGSGNPSALTNVTLSSNSSNYGGAIYIPGDLGASTPLDLTNVTIAFNSASASGGGIYDAASTVAGTAGGALNTIVAENTGGDCGGGSFVAAGDAGHNLDGDGSCFAYAGAPASDRPSNNPLLSLPALNGGPSPLQTDAEHSNSPTVDAGSNSGCPSTDERGLSRPMTGSDPCDIGAFEALAAPLTASSAAPATAVAALPFAYTITVSADPSGAPSTGTQVATGLPTGEVLYGTAASQGSCQSAGTPATVTCQLGLVKPGGTATVQLVVAATAGVVTNTAAVTNDEGQSHTTSATTIVAAPATPPPSGTPPIAITEAASGVTTATASLSGLINPGAQPTAFFFQYGLTNVYGLATTIGQTGTANTVATASLTGLAAGTTYHYRLVAINDSGTSYGSDGTFQTASTYQGAIRLTRQKLSVKGGKALIALKCTSVTACRGQITILTSLQVAGHPARNVTCTARHPYKVAPHVQRTIKAPIAAACRSALVGQRKLATKLTIRPTTRQAPVVLGVTLVL